MGIYETIAANYRYGPATSNLYEVKFNLSSAQMPGAGSVAGGPGGRGLSLVDYLKTIDANIDTATGITKLDIMMDEISLPGRQFATESLNGSRQGQRFVYPHSQIFSDISFTFICDRYFYGLKFLTGWMDYIATEYPDGSTPHSLQAVGASGTLRNSGTGQRSTNRFVRMAYPDTYMVDMHIIKTERGPSAQNQYAPVGYILNNAYPYAVESVPLSFGTSQLVKVTANFYYENWQFQYVATEGQ